MSDSWNEFLDEWEMNAKISDEWYCYILIDEAHLRYALRKLRWECTRIIKSLGIEPIIQKYDDGSWNVQISGTYPLGLKCLKTKKSFKIQYLGMNDDIDSLSTTFTNLSVNPGSLEIDPILWKNEDWIMQVGKESINDLWKMTKYQKLNIKWKDYSDTEIKFDMAVSSITFQKAWDLWNGLTMCKWCSTTFERSISGWNCNGIHMGNFNWRYWEKSPKYCQIHQEAIVRICECLCENDLCREFIHSVENTFSEFDPSMWTHCVPVNYNPSDALKNKKTIATALGRLHFFHLCKNENY